MTYDNEWPHAGTEDEKLLQEKEEEPPFTHRHYAGFWMRFWAYVFDLVIIFSLNGMILSPLLFIDETIQWFGLFTLNGMLAIVTGYLYFVLMTKFLGQTLGKMIFGLRVIRFDGKPLRWSDIFFREVVGRFIHRSLVVTNVLYVVVAFRGEKQGIHDTFAETRVIFTDRGSGADA